MTQNNVYSTISLATKAGKTVSGEQTVEKAIKTKKAFLVIVASDASDRTKKQFTDACNYYKVPIKIFGNKEELGHFMGKEFRATMAVTESGFAKMIADKINTELN